jgi:hypothetical protein
MKKKLTVITSAALILGMLLGSGSAMAAEVSKGSAGALADDSYTLTEMLTYAIQDEYAAQAEYQAIQKTFGAVRLFTNIEKAEAKHISALTTVFTENQLVVPANDAAADVVVPSSLKQSYETGVQAEINNIEMYQRFLKEDLPDNVRTVFENLMAASQNHLGAFERAASR